MQGLVALTPHWAESSCDQATGPHSASPVIMASAGRNRARSGFLARAARKACASMQPGSDRTAKFATIARHLDGRPSLLRHSAHSATKPYADAHGEVASNGTGGPEPTPETRQVSGSVAAVSIADG